MMYIYDFLYVTSIVIQNESPETVSDEKVLVLVVVNLIVVSF